MVHRNNSYFTHLFGDVNTILLQCKILHLRRVFATAFPQEMSVLHSVWPALKS
jgi:hypothetical protein